MPFSIAVVPSPGLVIVHASGPTTVENMLDLAAQMEEQAVIHEARVVLCDCARMSGALSLSDLHVVGARFAELARRTGVRVGAFNTPAEWRNNSFSEDVMSNRGAVLRHFATRQQALDWALASRPAALDQPAWAQRPRAG